MLARQLAIGQGPVGLVVYLYGPGKHNEHTDQHLVAGSDRLVAGFGGLDVVASRDMQGALGREFDGNWRRVRRERGLPLQAPEGEKARGAARADRVFHAVLSMDASEGKLNDEQWATAARMFVKEMGFIDSEDGADCPWMAVHHGTSKDGNDHLHIAVNLVRDDGRRASVHRSMPRTAQAGAAVAKAFGLEAAYDAATAKGNSHVPRPEWERARAAGREPDRVVARRVLEAAALKADSEAEFVAIARASGLLVLPARNTARGESPEGYRVKVRDSEGTWLSPSKMRGGALGLRALRERYGWGLNDRMDAIATWHDRSSLGREKAFRLPVVAQIEAVRVTLVQDQGVHWRRAARDLSGVLGAWSVEAGGAQGKYLGRASDALARASEPPRGITRQAVFGAAHTLITVSQAAGKNDTAARMALLLQALQLVDAIARRADAEREAQKARRDLDAAMAPLHAEQRILRAVEQKETFPPAWWIQRPDPVEQVLRELQSAERGPREQREERSNVRPREVSRRRPIPGAIDVTQPARTHQPNAGRDRSGGRGNER